MKKQYSHPEVNDVSLSAEQTIMTGSSLSVIAATGSNITWGAETTFDSYFAE